MKYNKSEIMKRAWALYRTGDYASFSNALWQSWREAKRTAEKRAKGYVTAAELNVGDTIAVEGYGGYENNCFTTSITAIRDRKRHSHSGESFIISFNKNNHESDISMDATEMIVRVSAAAVAANAA